MNSQQEKNPTFYDTHEQVGRSYADGRFKVLAQISEGCQPILNVKLFSRKRIPFEKAVGNKCSDQQGKRYKLADLLLIAHHCLYDQFVVDLSI